MELLPIVDAHHHLWDFEENTYRWLQGGDQHPLVGDLSSIRKKYSASEYLQDCKSQNVIHSVHIQAEAEDSWNETSWLHTQQGYPSAIIPKLDLTESTSVIDQYLLKCSQMPKIKGFRHLLNYAEDWPGHSFCDSPNILSDAASRGVLDLLESYSFHFELHIWPEQAEKSVEALRKNTRLRVVVNHTGLPRSASPEHFTSWKAGIEKLASLDNVSIKISGLPMMIHDVSAQNYKPYIDTVVALFGPDRCMIGSNFPVDKVIISDYDRLMGIYRSCISDLPQEQQKRILSGSAIEFYCL
eukprot:TRINITY_DN10329_c0_g1_i1.p1 TRINITY_DN10329_c0_g1~~TRINITY_DN10329_c0_g1_i1.p1  ORF type:complete len:298 (-),score=41.57 TRINITY_DN10329_c0_g1_i1:457-1350(-)